jgi:hypothetical protein
MEWYYSKNGKQIGPFSSGDIKSLSEQGDLESTDLVWHVGMEKWLPAKECIDEFTTPPVLNNEDSDKNDSSKTYQNDSKKKNAIYLLRHFRGELSLPVSYWLNGFFANIFLLFFVFGIAGLLIYLNNKYVLLIYSVAAIIVITFMLWQIIGIWRSADRYVIEKGRSYWAFLAKFMVIISLSCFAYYFSNTLSPAINESLDRAAWVSNAYSDVVLLRDGKEIELSGSINTGISDNFSTILRTSKNVEIVHVNLSQGGLVDEAMQLQKIINENNLSTYVSGECVSACTIVYLGGKKRFMKSSAILGFHAYKKPGVKHNEMFYENDKKYLNSLGVENNFITKIFNTPPDDMWYPTIDELIDAHVIHEVVSGVDFAISGLKSKYLTTELDNLITSLDNIKNATTHEESLRNIQEYKKLVHGDTSLLKSRAKSPASIEFVRLTDIQNNLSAEGELKGKTLYALYLELEKMNFETTDENEAQILIDKFVSYCKLSKEYISLISDIAEITNKKLDLFTDPIVNKELTGNQQGIEELLIRYRNNQVEIFADQEQIFKDNSCDEILSEN